MSQAINMDIPGEEGVGTGIFVITTSTYPYRFAAYPQPTPRATLPRINIKEGRDSQMDPALCSPCILRGQKIMIRR
jgi:hypothetical protein